MNHRNLSWVYMLHKHFTHTLPDPPTPRPQAADYLWLDCGRECHRLNCGCSGLLLSAGDSWTQKFSQVFQSLPLDSKLFAQMTHAAPGWILRVAITRISQTESLGTLMVLELFFGYPS